MSMTKKELKETFQVFLDKIPVRISNAKRIIAKKELDYSLEEIDSFGRLYKKHYLEPGTFDLSIEEFKYSISVYLEKAWFHYFGGKYELDLSKASGTYGSAIIVDWGPEHYTWIRIFPFEWLTSIENGDEGSISLPYDRKLHYFSVSKDWNGRQKKEKYE